MLRNLVAREILETFHTAKFLVAFAVYMALIPLALYTGQAQYAIRLSSYQDSVRTYQRELTGMKGSLEVRPQMLYRPSPLAVFSRDVIPYIPPGMVLSAANGVEIDAGRTPPPLTAKVFGDFDYLFVITTIVSLFSVLVMCDSVSGEKERGTLRLLLSCPVPRSTFFLSKYFGSLLANGAILLCAFVVGLLAVIFTNNVPVNGEFLAVAAIVFAATLLFVSAALLIGLIASVLTHKPTNSLLTAVLLWMVVIFLVPRMGLLAAKKIVPADSPGTVSLKQELIRKEILDRRNAELRAIFDEPDYSEARQPIAQRYQKETVDRLSELEAEYLRTRRRQERLAILLGSASPATHLTVAVTELTVTGLSAVERMLRDVRLYASSIYETVFSLGYQDQIPGAGVKMIYHPIDLATLPRFEQTKPSLRERIDASAWPLLALFSFNILLFVIAYIAGIRYDPR